MIKKGGRENDNDNNNNNNYNNDNDNRCIRNRFYLNETKIHVQYYIHFKHVYYTRIHTSNIHMY